MGWRWVVLGSLHGALLGCAEQSVSAPLGDLVVTAAGDGDLGTGPAGSDPTSGDPGSSPVGDGGQGGDATSAGGDPAGGDPSGGDPAGGDSGPLGPGEVPCSDLTCDGHGRCVKKDGQSMCLCDAGYHGFSSATNCRPSAGTPCENVSCGQGSCVVHFFGGYACACAPGWTDYGGKCIEERRVGCRDAAGNFAERGTKRCSADDTAIEVCHDGDGDRRVEWIYGVACADGLKCSEGCLSAPCPQQPCPVGTACVEEAHEQPLGVCVPTCECGNCGNCGPDNSDGRWNDWQEQCGAPTGPRPTAACDMPCPDAGSGCIPYSPSICWPMEGCFSGAP